MAGSLDKLVSIGGSALCLAGPKISPDLLKLADPLGEALVSLLTAKNGFYVFESALHVFPSQSSSSEIGLTDWNAIDLWKDEYQGMVDDAVFFAEDIFGHQFCAKMDGIYTFDPETGMSRRLSADFEGWAAAILGDFNALTGFSLAHEWQSASGQLAAGMRLVPKIPFIAGGEFSVQNLYALDSVKAMRLRGSIAVQMRDVPDGGAIGLRLVD
jgi:hypothetical protein